MAPASAQTYPLIVTPEALRKIGIAFKFTIEPDQKEGFDGNIQPLEHRCFRNDAYELSISEALLAHYRSKGFSLNTLCLQLQYDSPLLYHPETGKRLASIQMLIYRTQDGKRRLNTVLSDHRSWGFPIELPDCMKHGRIYSDCTLRYNIETGKKLDTTAQTKRLELGRGFERCVQRVLPTISPLRPCSCTEIAAIDKSHVGDPIRRTTSCVAEKRPVCPPAETNRRQDVGTLFSEDWHLGSDKCRDGELTDESDISLLDISDTIPGGFGYGIGPAGRGAGDPEPMSISHPAAVKRKATDSRLASAAPWFRRKPRLAR